MAEAEPVEEAERQDESEEDSPPVPWVEIEKDGDDEAYCRRVMALWEEANPLANADRRDTWEKNELRFLNKLPGPPRHPNQPRLTLPVVAESIDFLAGTMADALTGSKSGPEIKPNQFGEEAAEELAEANDRESVLRAPAAKKCEWWEAIAWAVVAANGPHRFWRTALEWGALKGPVIGRVLPENWRRKAQRIIEGQLTEPPEGTFLSLDAVDPVDFGIDPSGRRRYVIERVEMDLDEITRGAEAGEYEQSAADALKEGGGDAALRPKVTVYNFWGDLLDYKQNRLVHENCFIAVAHRGDANDVTTSEDRQQPKQVLLKGPCENPFDGIWPYFIAPLVPRAGDEYGGTLADGVQALAADICNKLSMASEGVDDALMTFYELDPFRVNLADWQAGKYPGMYAFSEPGEAPAIRATKTGGSVAEGMNFIDWEVNKVRGHMRAAEYERGLPATGGAQTATEVTTKTAQANRLQMTTARSLEGQGVVPLIRLIMYMAPRFIKRWDSGPIGQKLPKLTAQVLQTMKPEERTEFLKVDATVSARGVSSALQRPEALAALQKLMEAGTLEQLQGQVNFQNLLRMLVEALDQDPSDILNEGAPSAQELQMMQMLQELAARLQQAQLEGQQAMEAAQQAGQMAQMQAQRAEQAEAELQQVGMAMQAAGQMVAAPPPSQAGLPLEPEVPLA